MRILAIDTTTESCTVGLLNNGLRDSLSETIPQQHAALILPMIDKLISKHNLSLAQLDAIAVTVGPGSFTGIRIGTSVVQGLAFASQKPVVPISTLEVLAKGAYRVTGVSHVIAAIDARMGEIYWGEYYFDPTTLSGKTLNKEKLIQPSIATQWIQTQNQSWGYAGSAWEAYCQTDLISNVQAKNSYIVLPEAEDLLALAELKWNQGEVLLAHALEPIYLRDNVVHKSKNK